MSVTKECNHCKEQYICELARSRTQKYCSRNCTNSDRKLKNSNISKRELAKKYQESWRLKAGEGHAKKIEAKQFSTFYMTLHGRAVHMLNNARHRAKKHGVDCTITAEWIREQLATEKCSVTGIPFVMQTGHGKGHRINSFSPSIDRIVQTGGYTPENCRITCWIYNRARGAFPPEDFDMMIESLSNSRFQ